MEHFVLVHVHAQGLFAYGLKSKDTPKMEDAIASLRACGVPIEIDVDDDVGLHHIKNWVEVEVVP